MARSPLKYIGALFGTYLFLCFIQRLIYLAWIGIETKSLVPNFYFLLLKGVLFDLMAGVFLFGFSILVFIFIPNNWLKLKAVKTPLIIFPALSFLLVLFMAFTEIFFFAEFHSRFNFIAVDYLVYSHEVIRNAVESYPLTWIFLGLFALWLPFAYLVFRLVRDIQYVSYSLKHRLALAALLIVIPSPLLFASEDDFISNESFWSREVSKNTLFALFSAYNRNSIDFDTFYPTLDSKTAGHLAHEWLEEEQSGEASDHLESDTEDEESIVRNISPPGPAKNWNVLLVIVESLSAKFLGHYGNTNGLTPNLDRLADEGIWFQNLYATGTRTVRGLEALMLSLPPTPGQSILRRPKSEGIFNLGELLDEKGYHTQFVYGGYSYFDNMKAWFQSNGFEVVDRSSFASSDIHFANAWGVCDEDLFDQVLNQADQLHSQSKPFFQAILTTSNHRPYTYPEGRVDIPSHTGRSGAVKYTDYAIGRFIEQAKKKPWFKNTLFVIVADHDASVAGGSDIPVQDFLIPMIFYNPNLVPAQKVTKLGSQIDFAPTLLGLMNVSYQSRFFGQNLFQARAGRALMGTYQKVALLEPGHMTILSPGHLVESELLDGDGKVIKTESAVVRDAALLSEREKTAIAIYQKASELFTSGQDKIGVRYPSNVNVRSY